MGGMKRWLMEREENQEPDYFDYYPELEPKKRPCAFCSKVFEPKKNFHRLCGKCSYDKWKRDTEGNGKCV